MNYKKVAILGSTGSIGIQTIDIIRNKEGLSITTLAANSNIDLLEKQAREFSPELVCVYNEEKAIQLKRRLSDLNIKVVSGMDGLVEAAIHPSTEILVTAIVGMIGIRPTIEAIKAGKDIALANKETLVTAGHLIMPLVEENKINLFPVDSEHSAIFQCLNGENKKEVNKIILTASGGPFRGRKVEELRNIAPKDALKHPNWSMGQKITIDSATMANKGLEVIEAKWLFDIEISKIDVVVHPQSIIHSMVEYNDGSIIAQLGLPDMKLPIQYALLYPNRETIFASKTLNLVELGSLTFEEPDIDVFYALKLAYEAGNLGGTMPTVYNAANEWAVAKFLEDKIDFLRISSLIKEAMNNHRIITEPSLNDILETEKETYDFLRHLFEIENN